MKAASQNYASAAISVLAMWLSLNSSGSSDPVELSDPAEFFRDLATPVLWRPIFRALFSISHIMTQSWKMKKGKGTNA